MDTDENSKNYAKDLLVTASRRLFDDLESDEEADWSIVTKYGEKFKFHSLIVKHKSDILMRMITDDFIEKTTKTIEMKDMASNSVKLFLKFLYGWI